MLSHSLKQYITVNSSHFFMPINLGIISNLFKRSDRRDIYANSGEQRPEVIIGGYDKSQEHVGIILKATFIPWNESGILYYSERK